MERKRNNKRKKQPALTKLKNVLSGLSCLRQQGLEPELDAGLRKHFGGLLWEGNRSGFNKGLSF